MSFETYFRACSYAMIACGVLALALAGGGGAWLTIAFAAAPAAESRLLVANDPKFLWRRGRKSVGRGARGLRRLPLAALCLFVLIFGLALPIFFITPRAAEGALAVPGGAASSGFVGFSERVTLGDLGRLNESNQLVMRVRVEGPTAARAAALRWRGVALDRFDGRHWFKSSDSRPAYPA